MTKSRVWLWMVIAMFFLIEGGLSSPVLADQPAITVTINGQKLELSEPPRIQSDESNYLWLIVPVREMSNALGASVTWDPATNEAAVIKDNQTIILKPGNREVWRNGQQNELATPPQIINNRLQVSLNYLVSALGGRVKWDQAASMAEITTSQPARLPKPERIESMAFAARVAFTSDGCLWLVDGRQADSPPIRLTAAGPVEIVGWSANGEWLAYLQGDPSDEYASKSYLWVVKADGTGAMQLDERPVYIGPSWSPTDNLLAYATQDPQEGYIPDGNLKILSLKTGVVDTTILWPQNSEIIESLAWSPDGQSLAISLARNEKHPLRIDQITLKGDHTNLLTLGEAGIKENESYARVATGLKWSPNGHCLAYYLRPNSASLSADGVAIQVLDIPQKKSIDLGGGLAYAQWFDWAPDSSQLAYIVGGGREASNNKRLHTVDVKTCQITDCGQTGQVDTQPRWLSTPANGILFCRGTETLEWEGQEQDGVLVPGQRIWHRTADGKELSVTSGPVNTADYAPRLSPDGQGLFFLRLTDYNCGSLYYQPTAGGPPKELIRGVSGQPGYYGNYYPDWLNIYQDQQAIYPGQGKAGQGNGLYDFKLLYLYKNISLCETAKLGELISKLQYARELPVHRIECMGNNQTVLRIDYRMDLTEGQSYHVSHTKMMQDAVVLFAILDQLDAVEINLVQADYGYGGVPITRETAEHCLTANIKALGNTRETFSAEMPQRIANLKWNPGVMDIITHEHIMS